jgi:hypothetical protein
VDDAAHVRRGEAARDALAEDEGLGHREIAAREPSREQLSLEPLEDDEGLPLHRRPVRHVAHDRRVLQLGEGAHLAGEALDLLAGGRAEDLHRHGRSAVEVDRAVHGADAPGRRQAVDLEAAGESVALLHDAQYGAGPRRLQKLCAGL